MLNSRILSYFKGLFKSSRSNIDDDDYFSRHNLPPPPKNFDLSDLKTSSDDRYPDAVIGLSDHQPIDGIISGGSKSF